MAETNFDFADGMTPDLTNAEQKPVRRKAVDDRFRELSTELGEEVDPTNLSLAQRVQFLRDKGIEIPGRIDERFPSDQVDGVNLQAESKVDLSPKQPNVITAPATIEEARHIAGLALGAGFPGQARPEDYETMVGEITARGSSSIVDLMKEEAMRRGAIEQSGDLTAIITDNTSMAVKRQMVENMVAATNDTSIKQEFERTVLLQSEAPDANREEIKLGFLDYVTMRGDLPDTVWRIMAEEGITYDEENGFLDLTASFLLPGYGPNLFTVLNRAMPGFAKGFDAIFTGNIVKRFHDDFITRSPEEQEAVIRRIALSVEENTFYGMNNQAVKRDIMVTLLGDLSAGNSSQLFLNIISIMDLLALGEFAVAGGAAFKGIKNGLRLLRKGEITNKVLKNLFNRKRPPSVASKLDLYDPEASRRIVDEALATGGLPVNLGEDAESLIQAHLMIEPSVVSATGAASLHAAAAEILGFDGSAIGWNNIERTIALTRGMERLQAIKSISSAVHINKMQVTPVPGGLNITTYIGGSNSGFSDVHKARRALDELRGKLKGDMYVRDGRSGELRRIKHVPFHHRLKEYYVKIDETVKFSAEDSMAINAIRPDGTTGVMAKFLTKSSFLLDEFSLAGSQAGDAKAAKMNILSKKMAPITRMGETQRRLLEDLIDRGDQIGKWFSDAELSLEWGHKSSKEFAELSRGYYAFQDFQQSVWKMVNDGMHRKLDGLRMKHVVFSKLGDGDRNYLGEVVNKVSKDTTHIFDATTGQTRAISAAELENLTQTVAGVKISEFEFIRFRKPVRFGNTEVNYAVIVPEEAGMTINRLPDQVIKNVPGRLPRMQPATHLVKQEVQVFRNGVKTTGLIPIKIAKNRGEAQRVADQLNADAKLRGDKKSYGVYDARELKEDTEYVNRTSVDQFEDAGQLWFSNRGLELDAVDGTRVMLRPLERMNIAMERASRIDTVDLLAEKWVRNWEKEFAADFGSDGKMPLFGDLVRNDSGRSVDKASGQLQSRRFRDAIAMRDQIKVMLGLNEGMLQRNQRKLAVYIADHIATTGAISIQDKFRNVTATGLLAARNFDLVNFGKQAAFLQFIVGNPLRQLALQAQQASVYLTNEHAFRYFASGRGIKDYQGMVLGLASRDNAALFPAIATRMSKSMGMSVDEYVDFVDSMRKSGLIANIDSHAFSAGMITDRTYGGGEGFISQWKPGGIAVGGAISAKSADFANGIVRTAKLMRKMGFNAGESMQIIAAFLAKRNAWIKNNPTKSHLWSQDTNLAEIAASARQVSFEMTREGAMAFQTGIMGAIMQFASHNTKALQAMIPSRAFGKTIGKLSNKSFSDKQKAAIALSQLSIYGTSGFGVYEGYEQLKAFLGEEPPEELDLLIKEGIFGSLLTAIIHGALDDPQEFSEIDISGNLAPFSGVAELPLFRIMADATALGVFDVRNVPVVRTGSDIYNALSFVAFMSGKVETPSGDSETLIALDEMARLVPVWGKWRRAQAELAINRIITSSGNEQVKATGTEILARAFLGLQPTASRQEFEIRTQIQGRVGSREQRDEPFDQDLRDYAKDNFRHFKMLLQREGDKKANLAEVNQLMFSMARTDRLSLTDHQYQRVYGQLMPELIYSDAGKGDSESEFMKLIADHITTGRMETINTIVERVGQSEVLRNNEQFANALRNMVK